MPQIIPIKTENADFQHIETLRRNRQKRHQHRQFFVEGVRSINALIRYGWTISAFYYTATQLSRWATGILQASGANTHYELPSHLLAKLSQKHETSELLAVAEMPANDPNRIPSHENLLLVLLDRCSNPGNLGTVIRSCDALGADGLIMTGHSVDPYDPAVISASTGSLFALPILHLESQKLIGDWLETLRQQLPGLQVIGSSAQASTALYAANLKTPSLILVGNETLGLSAYLQSLCHQLIAIPMAQERFASSLNLACATTTILYETQRQRQHK
jgi:23S rRNA (uridine2479-2'-O)-methyltransferase